MLVMLKSVILIQSGVESETVREVMDEILSDKRLSIERMFNGHVIPK